MTTSIIQTNNHYTSPFNKYIISGLAIVAKNITDALIQFRELNAR